MNFKTGCIKHLKPITNFAVMHIHIKHNLELYLYTVRKLKDDLEQMKAGELDDKLPDMWAEICRHKRAAEEVAEAKRAAVEEAKGRQIEAFCIRCINKVSVWCSSVSVCITVPI